MGKVFKIGLVGAQRGGAFLRMYHNSPRSTITAVCDTDGKLLAEKGAEMGLSDHQLFTSFDEFLEKGDMDIVFVGTPIPFHTEQVCKAIKAGKHVMSEVTASNTVEGCKEIWDTVRASDRKYMMAENYIYFDFMQKWKKEIEAGKIGDIHYAEGEYIHDIHNLLMDTSSGDVKWRNYRPPIHYCTHCLGPIMTLIGQGDYIVKATGWGNKSTFPVLTKDKQLLDVSSLWPSSIDLQVGLFETKQGRLVKVCRSQVQPRPEPHTIYYSLYGTKGVLENSRHGNETVGIRYYEGIDSKEFGGPIVNCPQTDIYAPEYARRSHGTSDYLIANTFLDAVEFDLPTHPNVDFAMEITLPGIMAHEAALQEHVWLDVPHFTD